ncbi:hypothetical protein Cfor_07141 [Coptotermes formosanus]|uniref:Probable RNA-binding protein EIF1AD n=1 Tax=Coptotermes formosanus TaxID=36987 RepID=A0A6L2PNI9_COPFO|nr:hypothetical protein Cfor_07141 [Coptotermes formosanus]
MDNWLIPEYVAQHFNNKGKNIFMSRATKRKHVIREVLLDDLELPTGKQEVVRVLASRGNNLHNVEDATGSQFLVSMPTKFRRNVWIKRGDFVLVEPIVEGDKVKAEIVRILTSEHVKFFQDNNQWPEQFIERKDNKADDRGCTHTTFYCKKLYSLPPLQALSHAEKRCMDFGSGQGLFKGIILALPVQQDKKIMMRTTHLRLESQPCEYKCKALTLRQSKQY